MNRADQRWHKTRVLEVLFGIGVSPVDPKYLRFALQSGETCWVSTPGTLSEPRAANVGGRYFRIRSEGFLAELDDRDYCRFREMPLEKLGTGLIKSVALHMTNKRILYQDLAEDMTSREQMPVFCGTGIPTAIELGEVAWFEVTANGILFVPKPLRGFLGIKTQPSAFFFEFPSLPVLIAADLYRVMYGPPSMNGPAAAAYRKLDPRWGTDQAAGDSSGV